MVKIKRNTCKLVTLFLVLCIMMSSFTFTVSAAGASVVFDAPKATSIVNIDGVPNEVDWQISQQLNQGTGNNTAKVGTLWDENNLYIAFDVTDANVINSSAEYPWNDDSVEVYIDGDLAKTYNSHAVQYIFRWNDSNVYKYNNNNATIDGIMHNAAVTATGYTMEIAIPWSCIPGMTVSESKSIGFTVHVNDKDVNDSSAEASDVLALTTDYGNDWQFASNWAEMVLTGTAEPPQQTTPVTYDFKKLGGLEGAPEVQPGWSIAEVVSTHDYCYEASYGFHVENYDTDNRYASFNFDVPTTGVYGLKFKGFLAGGGALVDVIVDNQVVGQYDFFGTGTFGELKFLSNMMMTKGTHKLTLKVVGRTGNSWGYCIYASEFAIDMPVYSTLTYDFKLLGVGGSGTQPGWSIDVINPSYGYYGGNIYGLQFENYETYQDGNRYMSLKFDVAKTAPYELKFQGYLAGGGAISDILVDGTKVGQYDFYGSGAFGGANILTTVMLTQGTHILELRPVSRTTGSWGYCMYPSKFILEERLFVPELDAVTLSLDYTCLITGQTAQVDVTGILNDGKPASLTSAVKNFSSSDLTVATVDNSGCITAVGPGTAVINADVTLNDITKSGNIQVTVISCNDVEIILAAGKYELVTGQATQLTVNGYFGEKPVNLEETGISYSVSDSSVVSIGDNGEVEALKAGVATITVEVRFNGTVKSASINIIVVDLALKEVTLTAVRTAIFEGQTTESNVYGIMNNGEQADLNGAVLVFYSDNEAVATVSGSGVITGVSAGKANIAVDVTLNNIIRKGSMEITVINPDSITSSKTRSTVYTTEEVAAARENVLKYNWAKSARDSAIVEADKFLTLGHDYLWDTVTAQTLPRSFSTSLEHACPICGKQMYADYGLYGWRIDPLNMPWKLTCPKCGTIFPTNDFGAYYKSGLDEHGIFQPELADKSLLKNTLYPEKGDSWGVDDGFGFVDENGHKFTFIAYYNHWGLWYAEKGIGIISKALKAFRDAYLYTGDIKYARAGIILLDRIADVYPDFDLSDYKWDDGFVNSHGYTYQGKVLGSIWEPMMVTDWIYAYDAFFPAMEDQDTIDFLSAKALQYNLSNPKITAAAIRRNIEDNILRQVLPAIKVAQMDGNFGMHQSTLAAAAVVLDTMPETKEMLDFNFQAGVREYHSDGTWDGAWSWSGGDILRTLVDDVDRDGHGNEAAPGYNQLWLEQLRMVADVLDGYDLYPDADLYNNVKFAKMFDAMYPLTLSEKYSAQIGDTGGCGDTGLRVYLENCVKAFEKFGDPIYAQLAYFLNGSSINGIHGDIFSSDPEKVANDIKQVIDSYGTLRLESTNLTGFGFAVLRDGENFIKDAGIPYNFPALAVTENTSDFKLYSSSGTIQFQNERGEGERITFEFDVPSSDTYEIDLLPFKATSYGIYDIKLDGQLLKQGYDFYGGSGASSAMEIIADAVQIGQGTHSITFECTGKRVESENYKLGVRKLVLLNEEAQSIREAAQQKGDTQRDIWMYYGRNINHGHKDTLNLGMHAFGLDIAPDSGYPEQTGPYPKRMGWTQNTISHNTVVVDKSKQKDEYSGIPHHFDDSDIVKFIDTEAPNVYTQTQMYRRTTAMIKVDDFNSYTVDFFRVKGGNDHHFSFHSYEGPVSTEGLELTAQLSGTYAGPDIDYGEFYDGPINDWSYMGSGFQYLKNVQRDEDPDSIFSVDWDIVDGRNILPEGSDVHLRLTMITDVDDVAICDGIPPQHPENPQSLKYLIAHRNGSNLDSLFTSVLEPYKENRYIESICPAVVKVGEQIAETDVKAVKVVLSNGRTDYIISALDNNITYTVDDKFQFKGFFGVYSEKNGYEVYSYVNDGTLIGSLAAPKPDIKGTVVDFTREMSRNNEITVQLDTQDEVLGELAGKYIYIENDGVQNASYQIKGIKSREGSLVTFDIGDITLIQKWVNPDDFSEGYVYNISQGDEFRIPLAFSKTTGLSQVSLAADKTSLERNETVNLSINWILDSGENANLQDAVIEYVISNPAVVSVENGVVTAFNTGSADIYAKVTLDGVMVQTNVITFNVSVSAQSIGKTIEMYIASGELKGALVPQLENSIKQAVHQYNIDNKVQAVKHLEDFLKHLNNPSLKKNVTEAARIAMDSDIKALIEEWND